MLAGCWHGVISCVRLRGMRAGVCTGCTALDRNIALAGQGECRRALVRSHCCSKLAVSHPRQLGHRQMLMTHSSTLMGWIGTMAKRGFQNSHLCFQSEQGLPGNGVACQYNGSQRYVLEVVQRRLRPMRKFDEGDYEEGRCQADCTQAME